MIKVSDIDEIKIIEPDWKQAFQTLYGFCLGKGLGEEIEKCKEIQSLIQPTILVRDGVELK